MPPPVLVSVVLCALLLCGTSANQPSDKATISVKNNSVVVNPAPGGSLFVRDIDVMAAINVCGTFDSDLS
jgi:hypothetical protein